MQSSPVPRSYGAWAVAILAFLYYCTPIAGALAIGKSVPVVLVAVLAVGGLIGLALLPARHAQPLGTACAQAVLLLFTPASVGAAWVAQAELARRTPRLSTWVGTAIAMIAAKVASLAFSPDVPDTAMGFEITLATAGVLIGTLTGRLARSRADEAAMEAEADAARASAEESRIEAARLAERERLAREMHDVVAHRISLVALHAGALAHRADLSVDEVKDTAKLIQGNAQASLDELRAMLASLRGQDAPPEPPQPTLDQLPVLLADAEDVGQEITLETGGADLAQVEPRVSRHAFRIAQECLTNARKHAPGAPVSLLVDVGPSTLRLRASNPLTDLARVDTSGAGLGLVGIAERAALLGGSVRRGVREGQFVVEAILPLTRAERNQP